MKHLNLFFLIIFSVLMISADSLRANNIFITSNTNWSTITGGSGTSGQPSSSDYIYVSNATLTVDVSNAVCYYFILGYQGDATLLFNNGSQLTIGSNIYLGNIYFGNSYYGSLNMTSGGLLSFIGVQSGFSISKLGTWTPGTGTIKYSADGTQTVYGNTYNNLTLSGSGEKTTTSVTVNGTLSMEGSATASAAPTYGSSAKLQCKTTNGTVGAEWTSPFGGTGGIVIASNYAITLNEAKTLSAGVPITINSGSNFSAGSYSLTTGGNFTNNGTFTAGTGTVTFNGTSTQTIGGSSTTTFYNLTINNSNGVTLGTSEIVSGTLTLTSGKVTTGDYKLTLGSGTTKLGTLSPATPTSSSYIVGNFERWFAAITNTDFVIFPVGSALYFKPVGIKFTTAPTTSGKILTTASISDPQTHNTSNLSDAGYTIDRFSNQVWWQITPTTLAGGTYTIELGAYNIEGVSQTNFTKLRVLKRADGNSNWELQGTHADASGSYTEPLVTRSGLTSFSQFGIGGYSVDGNTLNASVSPVQLASLSSSITGRNVSLKWSTSEEINNSGFEIERKNNGGDFVKVGFVLGKGTVSTTTNYEFTDRNLQTGKYSYRLKQIDNNGNFEYFSLNGDVIIGIPTKFDLSQNYPNPFNPTTKVNFDLPNDGMVSLKVYDMGGREVATMVNGFRTAGYYTIDFNAANLSSGIYFYRISAGEFSAVKKMALIK